MIAEPVAAVTEIEWIFVVSAFFAGVFSLLAPDSAARSRGRGVVSRIATTFWIRKLGYQSVMGVGRIIGGMFVIGSFLLLAVSAGFPLPTVVAWGVSFAGGIPLGLFIIYKLEWPGRFAKEFGANKSEKVILLLSALKPGVFPSKAPEQPPQYCSSDSLYRDDKTDTNVFADGPVSFGPAKMLVQYFTVRDRQLTRLYFAGDIRLTIEECEGVRRYSEEESSSVKLLPKQVELEGETAEELASQCYSLVTQELTSVNSTSQYDQETVSLCLDTKPPTADGSGYVTEVTWENITEPTITKLTWENITEPTASDTNHLGAFSKATYHPEI